MLYTDEMASDGMLYILYKFHEDCYMNSSNIKVFALAISIAIILVLLIEEGVHS
jgi:hypothetical protein